MGYQNLRACLRDLYAHNQLIVIEDEIDPYLEMAELHRRVYLAGGPAIHYNNVKGSPFEAASNIYGTNARTEFIFRHTLKSVQALIKLKADPTEILRHPFKNAATGLMALKALPRKTNSSLSGFRTTTISQLPQIVSWPDDGGAFITLPQVLTLPPDQTNLMHSNVGMYRIQMGGNDYIHDEEIGLHYQIHRGIGVHHEAFNRTDKPFRASIFVGGPPAHAFAAIMPLPEGLSELTFAGLLAGRRFRYAMQNGFVISGDADFVITGTILKDIHKPEGPFGDHLGYYSLKHDFPVMKVERVYHRKNPIWQFTVVGRPPQEDSSFGHLIHELVGPLIPEEFPGIHEIRAVDAAGVHPLLLAIGSERYMPFREKKPEEILTMANLLLGKGQTSLTKYLMIADHGDDQNLSTRDIPLFIQHILKRIDLKRDLHFQTNTTIDTLDYSGTGLNAGSKLIMAASGPILRDLATEVPADLRLPDGFGNAKLVMPGICCIEGKAFSDYPSASHEMEELAAHLGALDLNSVPLVIVVDDSTFSSATTNNFLWVTFTRSNPSHDVYGVNASQRHKHWGCDPPLIIDARIKPHHAPVLEVDPAVSRRVDEIVRRMPMLSKLGI
ncbi:MAG: 3-octaprenyl-4-hydroxybenzoate carboxy-lyase [Bacteroidetes bacterium]|nr:MAG: 3-octaprenyl-4-hydroxybenzoate carboxy-lyase [Bacteroidota bacterium]